MMEDLNETDMVSADIGIKCLIRTNLTYQYDQTETRVVSIDIGTQCLARAYLTDDFWKYVW